MKKSIYLIAFLIFGNLGLAHANDTVKEKHNLWPKIPFNIVGANLCEYRSAYSQTRSQYIAEMVNHAENLLYAGDFNPTRTLMGFNRMYERNLSYARKGLGVTLEATFKAYLDSFYRKLSPRVRKLDLKYLSRLDAIINTAIRTNQSISISREQAKKIDLFAFGTYSMSPNCNGNLIVTLSIINKDGLTKEYIGSGPPSTVMSQVASRVFEDFQRTNFPSEIRIGNQVKTLIGGLNGAIDSTMYLEEAEGICESLGARLPNSKEYKVINSYGSWSGGITLGRKIWAMKFPNVFVPYFQRAPVRSYSQVNDKKYYYTCIK